MKFLKYYIFAFCFLLLAACDSNSTITIRGKLTDNHHKMIYLSKVTVDGTVLYDSTEIRGGKFSFKIKANDEQGRLQLREPAFYQLSISSNNAFATIARAGEKLMVNAVADSLVQTYTICGGRDAELMQQLDHQMKLYIDTVNWLENVAKFLPVDNDSIREEMEIAYMQKVDNHTRWLNNFIQQNKTSLAVIPAFYRFYGRRHFFEEEKNLDLLKKVYQDLNEIYPNNENVQYLKQRIDIVEFKKIQVDTTRNIIQ